MTSPLWMACQRVAAAQGFHISAGGDSLEDIARHSNFHVRPVSLRDDWWRNDGEPLLGFVGSGPAALLPARHGYHLVMNGQSTRITPALASDVSPRAYTFYPLLPQRPLKWWDLLRFSIQTARQDSTWSLVMAFFGSILALGLALVAGLLYEFVVLRGQPIFPYAILLLCIILALMLLNIAQDSRFQRWQTRVDTACQIAVWDRLLRLPSAPDIESVGLLVSGLSAAPLLRLVLALIALMGPLALLLYMEQTMALWLTILLVIAASLILPLIVMLNQNLSASEQAHFRFIQQVVRGIGRIRAARAEPVIADRWQQSNSGYRGRLTAVARIGRVINLVEGVIVPVVILVVLIVPPVTLDSSAVVAAFAVWLLMSAWTGLFGAIIELAQPLMIYKKLRPSLEVMPHSGKNRVPLNGSIRLENVTHRSLHGISLRIEAGQCLAITGVSGAGKSTLLRLLAGQERPESGQLYYDEQDSLTLDMSHLRAYVGAVWQNSRLRTGSIYANIAGFRQLPIEAAWDAARAAGIAEFIQQMPAGMHTLLDEGGEVLSQGQGQRILIARAIAGKPRLLILDEATNALDETTEQLVLQNLAALKITCIMVAQRRSTLIHAGQLIVLEGGHIAAAGNYDTVIQHPFFAPFMRQ